jgi:hypothetical protein
MWLAVWPGVAMASMRPAVAAHHFAVGERAIRPEVRVVRRLHARRFAGMKRARGAVRAFGKHLARRSPP